MSVNNSYRIERLQRQIDRIQDQIDRLRRFPEDNFPEGTVIRFEKQFRTGGTRYSYAAIKVDGKWFTTGPRSPKSYSWDELTGWMDEGVPIGKIEKVDLWSKVLEVTEGPMYDPYSDLTF